ncbi:MAG: redox-sensing transcriptional repressor Rex, partial [Oscillospiraceae bacterium]
MNCTSVGKRTLVRLPLYLSYLRSADIIKQHNISATAIANALCLNQVQVRKDLAKVSGRGKPKVGYETHELVARLEQFLGYDNVDSAVLVGAGHLGKALLSYDGFSQYGLKIVAAFD